jgi:hypothetical protein
MFVEIIFSINNGIATLVPLARTEERSIFDNDK